MDVCGLWSATKELHLSFYAAVCAMGIKPKRRLFGIVRSDESLSPDSFFPRDGMYFADLALCSMLVGHARRDLKRRG